MSEECSILATILLKVVYHWLVIKFLPSLKTNHYSPQPSASVNNVIYSTCFARGVNRITTHLFVV